MQHFAGSTAGHFTTLNAPTSTPPTVQTRDPSFADAKPTLHQPHHGAKKELLPKLSFVESIPQDARLQVLNFVIRNRPPHAAHKDLMSYAQTSKSSTADVARFHELMHDPLPALISSCPIERRCWICDSQKPVSWGLRPSIRNNKSAPRSLPLLFNLIVLPISILSSAMLIKARQAKRSTTARNNVPI